MNETIAGYQISEKLYESPKSLVYRTRPRAGERRVILKVLKREYPSPEELVRYREEFETTRSIHADGVVRVEGLERYRGTLVLLVEDFAGESLAVWMKRRRLSLEEVLVIALKSAEGLAQVHAAGVIHKDINPSNLVWNPATSELKIIDFGIATRLSSEAQSFRHPSVLEGTLAYISPEQTGRLSRHVDYRADFYALGATLYELLTGQKPFPTNDIVALVHSHIAKTPRTPHVLRPDIPEALSDIVLKLMAKNAEDRYQSARGLVVDLSRCLEQLRAVGSISPFPLGQEDISDRFQIPQRLYGREREIERLLLAFERVAGDGPSPRAPAMLLIEGSSGAGKTALIQEVYRPLTARRGIFAAGKFEQLRRDTPYLALAQALNTWCRHVLAGSAEELLAWKERILGAVGASGQVLIDVIDELERILGPQPPVPELGPNEAQNRFNLVFQSFLRAICLPGCPLVLFVDDLQWADLASLRLIKALMVDSGVSSLLLIGAYRDNEVDESHPTSLAIQEIRKAGTAVDRIHLANLGTGDVRCLLGDALRESGPEVEILASVLYEKTQGNAFHTIELIKSLSTDGSIAFDHARGRWTIDLERVRSRQMCDGVVDLMISKLAGLPQHTQAALRLAACLGSRFDLRALGIACQKSPRDVLSDLWPAAEGGFIIPLDSTYKRIKAMDPGDDDGGGAPSAKGLFRFQHDRVEQAAYSMTPEDERAQAHLTIGVRLLEHLEVAEREERLADIAGHLNLGRHLLRAPERRLELARLDLDVARKAKRSAAYGQALSYLTAGAELLPEEGWDAEYELTFAIHRERLECAFLCNNLDEAERLSRELLSRARSVVEKADVYSLLIHQSSLRGRYDEAIALGREAVRMFGVELPADDALDAAVQQELSALQARLEDTDIESLAGLQPTTDPETLGLARLLASPVGSAYFNNLKLWSFLTLRSLHLGLERGAFPELPVAFGNFGLISAELGKVEQAYRLTKVGLALVERIRCPLRSRVYNCLALCVSHWSRHVRESIEPARQGHLYGIEDGDLEFSCYCLFGLLDALIFKGEPLDSLIEEAERSIAFAARHKIAISVLSFSCIRQLALNMKGKTADPLTFNDGVFDEGRYLEDSTGLDMARSYFHIHKLQSLYLWGSYEEARRMAYLAEATLPQVSTFLPSAEHNFYRSLTLAALHATSSPAEQARLREELSEGQRQMRRWADGCPENFLHKALLVDAEIARIEGRDLDAIHLYHRAIDAARQHEFIQNEAIAHELAARFYAGRRLESYAALHITRAHHAYRLWGAERKAQELEQQYPLVLLHSAAGALSGSLPLAISVESGADATVLDAMSVVRAAQAISGEIRLDRLLRTLLCVVIENAGAERGALLLQEGEALLVEAEGQAGHETMRIRHAVPLDAWEDGPRSVVAYVHRTRERVVLGDATLDPRFAQDPYLHSVRPRSALCMPIVKQEQLVAVLYLENRLAADVFTKDRTEVLEILAGQVAVSLENAMLLAREQEARAAAERAVRLRDDFLTVASHELNTPMTSLGLTLQALEAPTLRGSLGAAVIPFIELIQRQAKRLGRLIGEMLDASRIEAGHLDLKLEEVDVLALAREVASRFAPDCQRAGCALTVSGGGPVVVRCDRSRLDQVLSNLLSNALKFGAQKPIEIDVRQDDHAVRFVVRDHGLGIAPAAQARVFERFERAVSTENYGGLGLGLFVCRHIVEAHGGAIRVESQPGDGAAFLVELPLSGR